MPLGLIDHHCHGVVTQEPDRGSFEALLTESPWPPAPGTSMFDSQLGFAVRRWCAPLLGLAPSAPASDYLGTRTALGAAEVNRRLLRASQVDAWLVDTGYQADRILRPDELADVSGTPAYRIVRLESVAGQVAGLGVGAEDFAGRFAEALADAIAGRGGTAGAGGGPAGATGSGGAAGAGGGFARAVGLKSVAAYRHGLDFEPSRPSGAEVQVAAARWLRAVEAGQPPRVSDPVLLRHIVWAGVDCGLPLQFHTGFGDPDARLHRSDPSLLHDFLAATRGSGASIMLLHCYPYHRQAGYLANVFPHVYMDAGEALNHVGARSAAVLAEALELVPFHKMLYSSDAFGLAELHYLAAMGFRRDLARVLNSFVTRGAWSAADAERVAVMIGAGNARRVYGLDG